MSIRILSALSMSGVVAAVFVALASCTQSAEVIEVPATVEVPVEVTREVPVTVSVDREVLVTRQVPVTVEVEVPVPVTVEVPVTVQVPVTREVEATRQIEIEVTREVKVPVAIEASTTTAAVCAQYEKMFSGDKPYWAEIMDAEMPDGSQVLVDNMEPVGFQAAYIALTLLYLIDAVPEDASFLDSIRGQSWVVLGYLCRDVFDLPKEMSQVN